MKTLQVQAEKLLAKTKSRNYQKLSSVVEDLTSGNSGCIISTIEFHLKQENLTFEDVEFIERKRKNKNTICSFLTYDEGELIKIFVDKKPSGRLF